MKYKVSLINKAGCEYDEAEFDIFTECLSWARRRTTDEWGIHVVVFRRTPYGGGERCYYANKGRLTKDHSHGSQTF